MEEGGIASFVVKDLGQALALQMCPEQSQALQDVKNSQPLPVGRRKGPIFFLDEPLPGAPRHMFV